MSDDEQFNDEKSYLIRQIRELNADTFKDPVPTATGTTSGTTPGTKP